MTEKSATENIKIVEVTPSGNPGCTENDVDAQKIEDLEL